MKIRLEINSGEVRGTRVFVDDVDVTNRCKRIDVSHEAGKNPLISVLLMKHQGGQPYLLLSEEAATEVATEIVTQS